VQDLLWNGFHQSTPCPGPPPPLHAAAVDGFGRRPPYKQASKQASNTRCCRKACGSGSLSEGELRSYQRQIVEEARTGANLIVVAPTGSGKTAIAIAHCAHVLEGDPQRRIVFLAPTVALAQQQAGAPVAPYRGWDRDRAALLGKLGLGGAAAGRGLLNRRGLAGWLHGDDLPCWHDALLASSPVGVPGNITLNHLTIRTCCTCPH
jgi:hypothetical protein